MRDAALVDVEARIGAAAVQPRADARIPAVVEPADAASAQALSLDYGRYSADWRSRMAGICGTATVLLIFAAAAFLSMAGVPAIISAPQPLTVVNIERLEAPAEPIREVPEGPEQIQRIASPPKPEERPPQPDTPLPPVPGNAVRPPAERASAAEQVNETTAPKSVPAPPASRAATNEKASWQALLLAHLEKYRRYPAAARSRGQQGVAQVTFRMTRQGRVLWSRLSRSSGSATLDHAAIDTLKRAQPLPAIPDDMPGEIELSVDVEFFTR